MSQTYEHIIVKGSGGGNPDPAEYCPIHGYVDETIVISNPLLPSNGWNLIATFQTNSPTTTTFDPTIVATSGDYAWDLGDGTILIGYKGVSHTYLTNGTRTVKLYCKGQCAITQLQMDSDNLIGVVDLSNITFTNGYIIYLHNNPLLTGCILPQQLETVRCKGFTAYSTGITGILDLSYIKKLDDSASFNIGGCNNLTGITFSNSITGGTIFQININTNPLLAGNVDISAFTRFLSTGANVSITGCPNLSYITTPSAPITGLISTLAFNGNTNITSLDISAYDKFTSVGYIYLYQLSKLETLQLPVSISGTIAVFFMYSCPKYAGLLDLSMIANYGVNASLQIYGNTLMTGIKLNSNITGTIHEISFYQNNLTGELDLSMVKAISSTATISFHTNPNLTNVKFSDTTITGALNYFRSHTTGITGVLDLSKFVNTVANGAVFEMHSCSGLTGITFAPVLIGGLYTLTAQLCALNGVLNLSMFKSFNASNGATITINNNPNLTGLTFSNTTITGALKTLNAQNCNIPYIDFTKVGFGVSNSQYSLDYNGMSSANINRMLYEINSVSTTGYNNRYIYLRGNNYPIDSTSGGYNGDAAKTALIAKGFVIASVTIPLIGYVNTSQITRTTARSGGNIQSESNGIVTERGICYSTQSGPTIADTKIQNGAGFGSYVIDISGLNPATKYYIRAYGINNAGAGYAQEVSFTTLS